MRTPARFSVAICFAAALIAIRWTGQPARGQDADAPATQPLTTRPTDELAADSPIRKWFTQLADADPEVRDKAREELMGISTDDLAKLRQLVIEQMPVAPDQSAALHDIVLQVYLANETYHCSADTDTNAYGRQGPFFLGLNWSEGEESDGRMGVVLDARLPGFPSYRWLRKGDMIVGFWFHLTEPLPRQPDWMTPNLLALQQGIESTPLTQDIVLQVVRYGRIIKVPVAMAPRPHFADEHVPGALQAFVAERNGHAEAYWEDNFAALFRREGTGPM